MDKDGVKMDYLVLDEFIGLLSSDTIEKIEQDLADVAKAQEGASKYWASHGNLPMFKHMGKESNRIKSYQNVLTNYETQSYFLWSSDAGLVAVDTDLPMMSREYTKEIIRLDDGEFMEEDHIILGTVLNQWLPYFESNKEGEN